MRLWIWLDLADDCCNTLKSCDTTLDKANVLAVSLMAKRAKIKAVSGLQITISSLVAMQNEVPLRRLHLLLQLICQDRDPE